MNNNKVPTAKELLRNHFTVEGIAQRLLVDIEAIMIEFAKLHCKAQAEVICEKATMRTGYPDAAYEESAESGLHFVSVHAVNCGGEYGYVEIEPDSILTAYPLSNIR